MERKVTVDLSGTPILDIEMRLIDDVKATAMLERNTRNRSVKEKSLAAYTRDMLNGDWQCNGIPIIVDEFGVIKDGQHRLLSIQKSAVPQNVLVITVKSENAKCYDSNVPRSLYDRLRIGEFSDLIDNNNIYLNSGDSAAIARTYMALHGVYKPTPNEIAKFISEHSDAIEFTVTRKRRSKKGVSKVPIFTAIACAYESGYSERMIDGFCESLFSGIPESKNFNAVIRLRDWCMGHTDGTRATMQECYFRTQYALKAVENMNTKAVSKAATIEYYKFVEDAVNGAESH